MTIFGGPLPNYPDCPVCGMRSTLIIGPDQAFCTNPDEEACRVLQFDCSLPDGGASRATTIDLSDVLPFIKDPPSKPDDPGGAP